MSNLDQLPTFRLAVCKAKLKVGLIYISPCVDYVFDNLELHGHFSVMRIFQQPITTVTMHGSNAGNKIAVMQSLRASLRIHRIAVAVLFCVAMAFVAMTATA